MRCTVCRCFALRAEYLATTEVKVATLAGGLRRLLQCWRSRQQRKRYVPVGPFHRDPGTARNPRTNSSSSQGRNRNRSRKHDAVAKNSAGAAASTSRARWPTVAGEGQSAVQQTTPRARASLRCAFENLHAILFTRVSVTPRKPRQPMAAPRVLVRCNADQGGLLRDGYSHAWMPTSAWPFAGSRRPPGYQATRLGEGMRL